MAAEKKKAAQAAMDKVKKLMAEQLR